MNHKKALKLWFYPVLATIGFVAFVNYFIDPLWCFAHSNRFNNRQPGFDERQQKTNRIYFNGLDRYDTLLLGSSRTAYVNQYDFKNMAVFNYAVDNMLPWEYEHWIDIATEIRGKPFERIIIGIDFFGTAAKYEESIRRFYNHKKPRDYLRQSEEKFYRFKTLLLYDAFKHSMESIQRTFKPTISDYDRKNVRHCNIIVPFETKKRYIQRDIKEYKGHLTKNYSYRNDWKEFFLNIKQKYPDTELILFTTPVSKPFFKRFIIDAGHLKDYERWLREAVEVNGKIYHFMDLNSVTTNLEYFFDAHHMYAKGVRWVAHRISGYKTDVIPEDFGKVLTQANLSDYLSIMKTGE